MYLILTTVMMTLHGTLCLHMTNGGSCLLTLEGLYIKKLNTKDKYISSRTLKLTFIQLGHMLYIYDFTSGLSPFPVQIHKIVLVYHKYSECVHDEGKNLINLFFSAYYVSHIIGEVFMLP